MEEKIITSAREFAGFVDGFRARNLVSIQQKIRVQLSEMETWLALLRTTTQAGVGTDFSDVVKLLSTIDAAFRDNAVTIADRLIKVSEYVNNLITRHGELIKSQPAIHSQLKAFIYAYIDAAEVSGSQDLFDSAVSVAETYRGILTSEGVGHVVPA